VCTFSTHAYPVLALASANTFMIYDELSALFGAHIAPPSQNALKRTFAVVHSAPANNKPQKRCKGADNDRRSRYLHQDYVSSLLLSDRLQDYDSGAKPTCHSKCTFHCQQHFLQMHNGPQFLREELCKWWGPDVSKTARDSLLAHELLTNAEKHEGKAIQAAWFVGPKKVCRNFYLRARGMHHEHVRRMQKELLHKQFSVTAVIKDRENKKEKENKTELAFKDWLVSFSSKFNEKSSTDDKHTVLPFRNVKPLYNQYVNDFQMDEFLQSRPQPLSSSQFGKLFNMFSNQLNIRLTRNTGDFLSCTVCDAYDTRIRGAHSEEERKVLREFKKKHNTKQQTQRLKYYKHRRKAREHPRTYLSIIIDGMDQKKTNCPVLGRNVKDESPLTQRVIGVKVHGVGHLVYVCDETVRGGGNLIIDVLRRTLLFLEKKGKLPFLNPVLYLQIDNCGENKNKTLFAFLTDLVRKKVFHKIKACFLMVGHTHDDIDQVFATISSYLKQVHIVCPDRESLFAAIKDGFRKAEEKPFIIPLAADEIFDYTAFYKNVIDKSISYHQLPHQFRIKTFTATNELEVVLVHYKNWAESTYWLPRNEESTNQGAAKPSCKGQLTRGQRADKIRANAIHMFNDAPSSQDIPENHAFGNNRAMEDLDNAQTQVMTCSNHLYGILWLTRDTNFDNFPLVSFTEQQLSTNHATVCKIFDDISIKFASKYVEIFSNNVMHNWKSWLEIEQNRWNPLLKRTTHTALQIPSPFPSRCPSMDEQVAAVVDSAPVDIEDGIEYVSHGSGVYGALTRQQQRDSLGSRAFHVLSSLDSDNSSELILENMACVYKYTYSHLQSGTDIEQIGVGIIVKVINPATPDSILSIRFCPPKGSKPQTSKRPDSLYQDIKASMQFNLKYKTKKRTKSGLIYVPDIEEHQSRDVLLAFNLDVTKEGRFGSLPRVGDHGGSFTSLQFAHHVIENYYKERSIEHPSGTSQHNC
jgi:hypothetical protein